MKQQPEDVVEKKEKKHGIVIGRALGEKARDCNRKSFGRTKRREKTEKEKAEWKLQKICLKIKWIRKP